MTDPIYPVPQHVFPQYLDEHALLIKRLGGLKDQRKFKWDERLGVGISGGGVRSATFALGVFQALADEHSGEKKEHTLLRDIDYLSTVSGGGYFGGFYGSLFVPKRRPESSPLQWADVEQMLSANSDQVRYLRENGAYLAPAGTGDLLLGMTVLARNWVAVMLVLVSLVVEASLALDLGAFSASLRWDALRSAIGAVVSWAVPQGFVLSPLFVLLPVLAVVWVVPLGWAYFLLGSTLCLFPGSGDYSRESKRFWAGNFLVQAALGAGAVVLHKSGHELWAIALAIVLSMAAVARTSGDFIGARREYSADGRHERVPLGVHVAWVICCTLILAIYAAAYGAMVHPAWAELNVGGWSGQGLPSWKSWVQFVVLLLLADLILQLLGSGLVYLLKSVRKKKPGASPLESCPSDIDQYVKHYVSEWLKQGLLVAAGVLIVGVVHTLGRTIYAQSVEGIEWLLGSIAGVASALAAGARQIVVRSTREPSKRNERPSPWLSSAQYLAGGTAALVFLLFGAVLGQLIFFQTDGVIVPLPEEAGRSWEWVVVDKDVTETCAEDCEDDGAILPPLRVGHPTTSSPQYPGLAAQIAPKLIGPAFLTALGLLVFLVGVGGLRRFLNGSTHLGLYSARITRTFLGASNRERVRLASTKDGVPPAAADDVATHLIAGDDVPLKDYYRWPNSGRSPYEQGAPLHLINVTINETIDGRSQTQQADRRGVCMAVGPCGLSVGVRHHAVFEWGKGKVDVHPALTPHSGAEATKYSNLHQHRVFGVPSTELPTDARGWIAHTMRSSRSEKFEGEALSLGRWLGISGAAFTTGLGSRTNIGLSLLLGLTNVRLGYWWRSGVIPEFRWSVLFAWLFWTQQYLLRELTARFSGTADRLWYLSDGGHFENLAGYELIRRGLKQIIIIDTEADPASKFDGLGNLVRKARLDFGVEIEFLDENELKRLPIAAGRGLGPITSLYREETGFSKAHAALARVTYPAGGGHPVRTGWLLYIKPTLLGDEPGDVLQYRCDHRSFPHEPTSDQFFNEAQWESYRRLGEKIGRKIFKNGQLPFTTEEWAALGAKPIPPRAAPKSRLRSDTGGSL